MTRAVALTLGLFTLACGSGAAAPPSPHAAGHRAPSSYDSLQEEAGLEPDRVPHAEGESDGDATADAETEPSSAADPATASASPDDAVPAVRPAIDVRDGEEQHAYVLLHGRPGPATGEPWDLGGGLQARALLQPPPLEGTPVRVIREAGQGTGPVGTGQRVCDGRLAAPLQLQYTPRRADEPEHVLAAPVVGCDGGSVIIAVLHPPLEQLRGVSQDSPLARRAVLAAREAANRQPDHEWSQPASLLLDDATAWAIIAQRACRPAECVVESLLARIGVASAHLEGGESTAEVLIDRPAAYPFGTLSNDRWYSVSGLTDLDGDRHPELIEDMAYIGYGNDADGRLVRLVEAGSGARGGRTIWRATYPFSDSIRPEVHPPSGELR